MLLLSLSLALIGPARADEPVNPFEEPDESELFELDEQIVTVASRYAQTVRKAPSIVTLVTAEEIRERGYRTISELLRDLPGIYVWKSQEGRDLAAFRGIISADNNKILLLVDGVPWYDGVYTHAFIDDFMPISHIRQVEVIKGPGSAIYGTNAFAGVINVVTFDGDDLEGARVRAVAGSVGRADVTVTAGGRTTAGGVDITASAYARVMGQIGEGLDVTPRGRRDILGQDKKTGVTVGARARAGGLRLQLHHADYRHSFLTSELDDPYDALGKDPDAFGLYYHNTFFDVRYAAELARDVTLTPYLFSHRHDNPGSYWFHTGYTTEDTGNGLETEEHLVTVETDKDTRRWGAGLDLSARFGIDHVSVAGLGMENVVTVPGPDGHPGIIDLEYVDFSHEGESTGFEGDGRLRNLFAYAQHTWTALPSVEFVLGGRIDMRVPANPEDEPAADAFQPVITPRVGVLLVPTETITLKLLYGRAFRQPNARELLVTAEETDEQGNYVFSSGNLDLLAERIDTAEAELSWTVARPLSVRLDGYYSMVVNEIDKITPPNEYRNVPGTLTIAGGEAEIDATLGPLRTDVAYAYTRARYGSDAGPYADRPQYEFPPHMVKGSVDLSATDQFGAVVFGELYSYRPRIEWAADVALDDGDWFGLVHASLYAHGLGKEGRWGLNATMRNVLDSAWGTAMYRDEINRGTPRDPRYPEEVEGAGRSVTLGIEAAF